MLEDMGLSLDHVIKVNAQLADVTEFPILERGIFRCLRCSVPLQNHRRRTFSRRRNRSRDYCRFNPSEIVARRFKRRLICLHQFYIALIDR